MIRREIYRTYIVEGAQDDVRKIYVEQREHYRLDRSVRYIENYNKHGW